MKNGQMEFEEGNLSLILFCTESPPNRGELIFFPSTLARNDNGAWKAADTTADYANDCDNVA